MSSPIRVITDARLVGVLGLVAAALVGVGVPGSALADSWEAGPVSGQVHEEGVSVELPGGEVLVAGGDNTPPPKGDLLASNGSAFKAAGEMKQERFLSAAALLPDGDVLIAGGDETLGQSTPVPTTDELWSPAGGGTFTLTGAMNVPRQVFTLTTLPNGEALAVGGAPDFKSEVGWASAELFNPATEKWTMTGAMAAGRLGHTATLLPDCRVLIVGDNPTATTYNYLTGTFSLAGSEGAFQRSYQTSTLLANGKVLIAGGQEGNGTPLATASVWDPATGTFTPTATPMSTPRTQGFAALLSDGRVIVGGGLSAPKTPTNKVDIYDPATNSWSSAAPLPPGSEAVSAETQTLSGADVAVMSIGPTGTASEIYKPSGLGPAVSPPPENCSNLANLGGTGGSGGSGAGTGGSGSGSQGPGPGPNPGLPSFAIRSVKATSNGAITLTVSVSAAGKLTATATTTSPSKHTRQHSPPLPYGSARGGAAQSGTIKLTIRAGRRAAALLRSRRALRVTIKVQFHPNTGPGLTKTVSVTVRRSTRAVHANLPSFLWNSWTAAISPSDDP
jgi:hypothetical protein